MNEMQSSDKIEYLKFLLEQVKLQQEVRDRWFSYYLTIAGAVLGVGIAAVKFFYSQSFVPYLCILLLVLTVSMFLIGSCFFMIYLRQRLNYLKYYRVMEFVEKKLIDHEKEETNLLLVPGNTIKTKDRGTRNKYFAKIRNLKPHKFGADFYTVCIHIVINSFYLAAASLIIVILIKQSSEVKYYHYIVSVSTFVVSSFCYEVVRRRNYK